MVCRNTVFKTPKRVIGILNWLDTENLKEIYSIIELEEAYCRFDKYSSRIVLLLTTLVHKLD